MLANFQLIPTYCHLRMAIACTRTVIKYQAFDDLSLTPRSIPHDAVMHANSGCRTQVYVLQCLGFRKHMYHLCGESMNAEALEETHCLDGTAYCAIIRRLTILCVHDKGYIIGPVV